MIGLARRQALVLFGGLAFCGIIVGVYLAVAQYLYERRVDDASSNLRRLSYMVADHANRSLKAVDLSVAKLVERLRSQKPASAAALVEIASQMQNENLLKDFKTTNPFLVNMLVVGADGRVDERSRGGALAPQLISEGGYLAAVARAPRGEPVVTSAFFDQMSRSWMIGLSRPVLGPDGAFIGAVAGVVDLSAFDGLLGHIALGPHGSLSIFAQDGSLVAWAPRTETPLGARIADDELSKLVSGRQENAAEQTGVYDGVRRLYAGSRAEDFPLSVVAASGVPELVAGWAEQVRMLSLAAVAAMVFVLIANFRLALRIDKVAEARERQLLERQMAEQARTLANAINNVTNGVAMFDKDGRLMVWNSRYAAMFGFPEDFLKPGMPRAQMLEFRGAHGFGRTTGRPTQQPDGSVLIYQKLNDGRVVTQRKKPLPEGGWVSTHEDVTEQLAAQARIHEMATRDGLTGLLNRFAFMEQLERAVEETRRGLAKYAIFYLDLDRFKQINDTLGHPAGDELLKQVAGRLRGVVRKGDSVARLGGDEFALLQRADALPRDAVKLADRIIRAISAPCALAGSTLAVGASIGISILPTDGLDGDQALRNADLALYQSKNQGRGVYNFFSPAMDEQVRSRRALEEDLRSAIAAREFELYYQPVVSFSDGVIRSFEALIRWRHPSRGFVSPGDFIPVAEDTGLIVEIGEWVLREACAHAARWPSGVSIGVNVSPAQFRASGFLASVRDALRAADVAPSRLVIEITEGVMVRDADEAGATIDALRAMGILVAMDDFGTGYSSLSYFQRLRFDKVKIDRSFVSKLGVSASAEEIVRAIVALAGALNLVTVAEGIETEAQHAALAEIGCEEAQGYLLGRPLPAAQTLELAGQRVAGRAAPALAQGSIRLINSAR